MIMRLWLLMEISVKFSTFLYVHTLEYNSSSIKVNLQKERKKKKRRKKGRQEEREYVVRN